MHTVALIAWTVLICFRGEGGSRYSGKTPKASKNGLQLCPKTIKFQAQGRQSWSPEGSWAGLGTSCAILGQLGRFWQLFGASWKRRWRVLGRLGRKRWPTWYQVGRQNGSRIDQKWIQKSICFMKALGDIIFQYILAFWNQNPYHVGSKINSKFDLIWKRRKARNYYKTYMILMKNEASGVEKWIKNQLKLEQNLKPRWGWLLVSIFHGFSWILGGKLEPSWCPKSIKNRSDKAIKKRLGKKGVLGPFPRHPGPFLDHLGRHVRPGEAL